MADDIGGVWRTVGGRRIFIKDGQDLASAMKESGKFNNKSQEQNDYKEYYEGQKAKGSFSEDNPDVDYENNVKDYYSKEAIKKYTAGEGIQSYENINNYLNGNKTFNEEEITKIKDTITKIDKCIENKTQVDLYTYRGIAIDSKEIQIGDEIKNKGYTSTSISKYIADDFTEYYKGTTIKIKVKKGTKALFIGPHSGSDYNEEELLFGRNTKIVITGKDDNGVYGELIYD